MKKLKTKKALVSVMTLAFAASLGFGFATISVNADTEEQSVFEQYGITLAMDKGAGVRKYQESASENGIRFIATINNSIYEEMEKAETETIKFSYGMLIASAEELKAKDLTLTPESVFGTSSQFAWAEQDEEGNYVYDAETNVGKTRISNFVYETLPTGEDYSHATDERVIAGSITNFKYENLTLELVGVGYIACTTESGTQYLFAENNNNTVSMTYVAQVAIEKGLDVDGKFEDLYVDTVPQAYQATTYEIEYLFENENGEYVADETIANGVVDGVISEKTTLADIPEKFTEKPGYIVDSDKNEAETAKTIYANGKTTVQAYYRKAEIKGINAVYTQGNTEICQYNELNSLKNNLVVEVVYEDDSTDQVTDYTLSGELSIGESVITVTVGDYTDTFSVNVTELAENIVQNFDYNDYVSVTSILGKGGISQKFRMGETGSAAYVAFRNSSNAETKLTLTLLKHISSITTVYYYVYFDSESVSSSDNVYNKDNLPTLTSGVVTRHGLSNEQWTLTALSDIAWDTWVLVKAEKKAGQSISTTATLRFVNWGVSWEIGATYGDTGLDYVMYMDNITTNNPETSVVNENLIQDFNDSTTATVNVTYGKGGISEKVKMGTSGSSLYCDLRTGSNPEQRMTVSTLKDISSVDTLYYYVYFDSSDFKSEKNTAYSKDNLPALTNEAVKRHGLSNEKWDSTALTEIAWDTWILVKSVKKQGNTDSTALTLRFVNWGVSWGTGTTSDTGFRYLIYMDNVTLNNPLES